MASYARHWACFHSLIVLGQHAGVTSRSRVLAQFYGQLLGGYLVRYRVAWVKGERALRGWGGWDLVFAGMVGWDCATLGVTF